MKSTTASFKSSRPPSSRRSSNSRLAPLTPIKEAQDTTSGFRYQEPQGEEEQKDGAIVISEELVFKNAMTSDLKSFTQLALISEQVNYLNFNNAILVKLPHLVKLDLSFNKIE